MIPIRLGKNLHTGKPLFLHPDDLRLHSLLLGRTGGGKTTAIHAILRALMKEPADRAAIFVIDPMGGLSQDLLLFMASEFCPQHVRDRLLYIEAAREDFICPFNPLLHDSESNRFFQVLRAMDIVMRAWSAQNFSEQPRLFMWTYNAFCSLAMMGLPIAMCRYLLHPGTEEHAALIQRLPDEIRARWDSILKAKGGEATRILESTRNRLNPFGESRCLRQIFGHRESHFDVERFVLDRRIVILNVAELGKVPGFVGNTIGSLALNEIISTCTRLTTTLGRHVVNPTYILMDEFQKFISPDIEQAIPTVRQLGIRLIMACQSFSQLEQEDLDLTHMIWQAQLRLIFGNAGRDADIMADELAKCSFDPYRVKDSVFQTKQLISGFRREVMRSTSTSISQGQNWSDAEVIGFGQNNSVSEPLDPDRRGTESSGKSNQKSNTTARGNNRGESTTSGESETNVPIFERFKELSNRTYFSFDEYALEWGRYIRELKTGEAYLMRPNRDDIDKVLIDYVPIEPNPRRLEAVDRLLEENFKDPCFISQAESRTEEEELRRELLRGPKLRLETKLDQKPEEEPKHDPFH